MVNTTEKTLTNNIENGGLGLPNQEKAEAVKAIRTNVENSAFIELNAWVKACRHLPSYAQPGQPLVSRIISSVEGVIVCNWKKQETDGVHPLFCAAGRGHGCARWIPKEEDKDSRPDQTYHATLRSRCTAAGSPRGNMTEALWPFTHTRDR